MPLDVKKKLEDLRSMYHKDQSQDTASILLCGQTGVGKTTLLETAPAPILIHSFDPRGTQGLKSQIEASRVIVDNTFEVDEKGKAFDLWETELSNMVRDKEFFKSIGTYCVDSLTLLQEACGRRVARVNNRPFGALTQPDWGIVSNVMKDWLKLIAGLPCYSILTAHLMLEKEEVSGTMLTSIVSQPALRNFIPSLFSEVWCLTVEQTSSGNKRVLITDNTGKYLARTRIGRGKFSAREENPNIQNLLKKAGYKWEDKEVV